MYLIKFVLRTPNPRVPQEFAVKDHVGPNGYSESAGDVRMTLLRESKSGADALMGGLKRDLEAAGITVKEAEVEPIRDYITDSDINIVPFAAFSHLVQGASQIIRERQEAVWARIAKPGTPLLPEYLEP